LAVATSDQSVLVYSLPRPTSETSTVLSISPNFVCSLKKGGCRGYQQVTRVSWFAKDDGETLLAAGYVNGLVAVWSIADDCCSYPQHVIQAHTEAITGLDFKSTETSTFHLLTTSLDRLVKFFTFDGLSFQEVNSNYAPSRALWAEWWLHWPGFMIGFDDCFSSGAITHRQPLDFGSRSTALLNIKSSITSFNINHWLNFVMLANDAGDVLGCQPNQMIHNVPKDRWDHYQFEMFASTDSTTVTRNGRDETAIVFSDYRVS
jgi:WD40 repeat protein